jgi:gamma-glutamyltranspeptidase / glutathione hydrolase
MVTKKQLISLTILALVIVGIIAKAKHPPTADPLQDTRTQPAIGQAGMVSAAHPLATQAGLDVLAAGGNAFDAAVAVAATLNVVEPMMSGIGGYGTIIAYDAKRGEAQFLNCSGRMPAALNSDVFRPPTPNYLENRRGAKAVSTPGNVNAWEALSKKYGKLAWRRLFDGAIKAAEDGFVLSAHTANAIKAAYPGFPEHATSFYGQAGEALKAGQKLVQKDLARSLRLIAEQGAKAVHGGELGQAIAAVIQEAGGFLSLKDLRDNRAEWWKPISINYRDYQVVTAPPPANAFDMLVRLGMMSRFDLTALGHNSTPYLHRFAEVTKHGFWVRLRYASDPDVKAVPLATLLSEKYWVEEVAKLDPQRAKPFEPPKISAAQDTHTTHFVVADQWGNIISATQTLGNIFGSRIMPKGTGIWLNNSLAYSTFEPKGNPMDAFPGRHKLSGDCPTIIMRQGRPWVAIGTPGGHSIGQTVPQMIINLIDFQMDIQQAIAAPRISFIEPDALAVEGKIPESVRQELAALGHKIRVGGGLGNAHGLTIEYDATGKPIRFTGGADPRGEGLALGFQAKQ